MNCPHCETVILDDAKFCLRCGKARSYETGKPPKVAEEPFMRAADRDGHNGIRGQHRQQGEVRFHYGHACRARETVQIVERSLDSQDLQTQIIESDGEIVVQGKRKPNLLKRAFGLDQAVTVVISVEGKDMKTVVGGAKWIDKAAGAAIGWFVFFPAMFTAG